MEIGKLLNPKAGTEPGQSEDKSKGSESTKAPDSAKKSGTDEGQRDWEDKMKSKGMPTQGLNTFRVKKQG
ncbi:hypothetical protein Q9L58_005496 [Maublancomyces gigas]|uniref:Uncharacterized protein n=1 Tax=Discina gigas TaxID=1032678 RepID=A0ABR3GI65_9PEZI